MTESLAQNRTESQQSFHLQRLRDESPPSFHLLHESASQSLSPNHSESPPLLDQELETVLRRPESHDGVRNHMPLLSPQVDHLVPNSRSASVTTAFPLTNSFGNNRSEVMEDLSHSRMHNIFFPPKDQTVDHSCMQSFSHSIMPRQTQAARDQLGPVQLTFLPNQSSFRFPLRVPILQPPRQTFNQSSINHQPSSNHQSVESQRQPGHNQSSSHVVSIAGPQVNSTEFLQAGANDVHDFKETKATGASGSNAAQPAGLLAPMIGSTLPSETRTPPDFGNSKQIMRSGLFCPSYFTGTSQEDSVEFVRIFNLWAKFNQLDSESAISAFQLLLRGSAATWFKTLPKSSFSDFQELSKLFIARYTIYDKPWNEIGNLWNTRQTTNQKVHDFVSDIQFKGDRLQLSADTVFQIVLHGLLPGVKNCVLQKGVKNIEDLLQVASLFELANDSMPDTNSQILQSLAEMKEQMERLQLRPISPMAPLQNASKKVQFLDSKQVYDQDYAQNYPDHSNFRAAMTSSSGYKNDFTDVSKRQNCSPKPQNFRPNFYRREFQNDQQTEFSPRTPQSSYRSNFNPKTSQNFYNKSNPYGYFQNSMNNNCRNCGNAHRANDKCPAFGVQCRFCLRRNHFTRFCLKAKARSE